MGFPVTADAKEFLLVNGVLVIADRFALKTGECLRVTGNVLRQEL